MSVAPRKSTQGKRHEDLLEEVEHEGSEEPRAKGSPAKPAEMSHEVIEFIQAIDEYKRLQQRPFPSWSEVLEVLKSLGYSKPA